jgi:uncharacterized protein YceK
MRRLAIVLVIGASLAGCAMHTARMDDGQGYALYNDKAQKQSDDKERAQAQSARDFAQPMGWFWY